MVLERETRLWSVWDMICPDSAHEKEYEGRATVRQNARGIDVREDRRVSVAAESKLATLGIETVVGKPAVR